MNRLMLTTTVYVTFLFESRIHYHYAWAASCIEFCMLADTKNLDTEILSHVRLFCRSLVRLFSLTWAK